MSKNKRYSLALVCMISAGWAFLPLNKWEIAPGYQIRFYSNDPSGEFTNFKGEIVFDEEAPEQSHFHVSIEAGSIDTGNWLKNRHARGKDWLNTDEYPFIEFTSSKVSRRTKGYEVTGILSMHGVRKEIMIPFAFVNRTFSGTCQVNRLDFGIGNSTGVHAKADTLLQIDITVPVTRKPD